MRTKAMKKLSVETLTLHGSADTRLMIFAYAVMAAGYGAMASSCSFFLHADQLAMGGNRPIQTMWYLQWIIVHPILLYISGRTRGELRDTMESQHEGRLQAAVRCTAAYKCAAWAALASSDAVTRQVLVALSMAGWCTACAEASSWGPGAAPAQGAAGRARAVLLPSQVLFLGACRLVSVLRLLALLGPRSEQLLLTALDVLNILVVSVLLTVIRNKQDLAIWQDLLDQGKTTADDLTNLITSASAPIFSVDAKFRITVWNQKIASLTGIKAEKAAGRSLLELLRGAKKVEAERIIRLALDGQPTKSFEVCIGDEQCSSRGTKGKFNRMLSSSAAGSRTASSGSFGSSCSEFREARLVVSVSPQRNAQGHIVGMIGVGQDLTEIDTVKDAEARKSHFLAVVSHELRTPLHGIIGLTEVLRESEENSGREKQLRMIKNCAARLLDLVCNIMEMSTMVGSGAPGARVRRPLSRESVDLALIVSEVVLLVSNATDKMGRSIIRNGVSLVNNVPEDLPIIEADAHKCTQVFYNLVINACKFTSAGVVTVSSAVLRDRELVEIEVADTGKGIAPEALERIFEPFEQEDNSEVRSYEGIGLGLSIAREVIEQHGGRISVVSALGGGSTFKVQLPMSMKRGASDSGFASDSEDDRERCVGTASAARASTQQDLPCLGDHTDDEHEEKGEEESLQETDWEGDDEEDEEEAEEEPPPARCEQWQNIVILSVDDDAASQAVIQSMLSRHYRVDAVANGQQCLEYLRNHARCPDLLLMGVMMPGMSGPEVCRKIRKELGFSPSKLPIVLAPAQSPEAKAVHKFFSAGASDYIAKPFDRRLLHARVHAALQVRRIAQMEENVSKHTEWLHSIIPPHMVARLEKGESLITDSHKKVTILVCDIMGWTSICQLLTTPRSIALLHTLWSAFDEIVQQHGVSKVETVRDVYTCAAGHDGSCRDHASRMARVGLAMLRAVARVHPPMVGLQLQVRIGLHTGPAYTGIVGMKLPRYCFFGDTVEIARCIESNGAPGCLHISSNLRSELPKDLDLGCPLRIVKRGCVEVSGKVTTLTHLLVPSEAPDPAQLKCTHKDSAYSFTYYGSKTSSAVAATREIARAEQAHERAVLAAEAEDLDELLQELGAARAMAGEQAANVSEAFLREHILQQELATEMAAFQESAAKMREEQNEEKGNHQEIMGAIAGADALNQSLRLELVAARASGAEEAAALEAAAAEALVEVASCASLKRLLEAASRSTGERQEQCLELEERLAETRAECQALRAGPPGGPPPGAPRQRAPEPLPGGPAVQGRLAAGPSREPTPGLPNALSLVVEAKEQELQHLRLELQLRDKSLGGARAALAAARETIDSQEMELQHALLDLRQCPSRGWSSTLEDPRRTG